VQRLRRDAAAYADLGFDVPWLDRDDVARRLGTDAYLGGILLRTAAVLDPYRLVAGLAERAVAAGVRLFETSPVLSIREGRLTCPHGEIHAGTVVLATDAGTSALGVLTRSVEPIDTHVLRTGPLPAGVLPSGAAVIDARNYFHYYRPTADGRLVFGGGPVRVRTSDPALEAARSGGVWRRLEDELRAVFPALADVPVTDRWYGRTGATLDRMPVVGPLRDLPGAWGAVGWSGHGIALSLAAAHLLADVVEPGRPAPQRFDNDGLPWLRGTAPGFPMMPGRRLGIATYLRWLDIADRAGLAASGRRELTTSAARPELAGAAR
jgi:glycine/D-amino acid oxidase-like deaminating enzyme